MYCRNCGKEVTKGVEFCPGCGAKPGAGKKYCFNCGSQTSEIAEICVKCGAKLVPEVPPKAPPLTPGVMSAYKWGWNKLWLNFWLIIAVVLVGGLLEGAASGTGVLAIFVAIPIEFGIAYCYLKAVREGKFEFENLFDGFKHYWSAVGAGVLSSLIIIGGLILLIVPGIIFAIKLAFVPYLVMDRNMGATEAIKKSWEMTRGHSMEIFAIVLLAIPILIIGLMCLFVGVFVSITWIYATLASLYYAVSEEQKAGPNQIA